MKQYITRENALLLICLIFAAIFGWGFFSKAGFPPTRVSGNWQSLLVFMVLLIIPFAKKFDLFQVFSFEAKIDEVRKEVSEARKTVDDVKGDVRHIIAQQNMLSNSLQTISNQRVTVNNNYSRPPQDQVDAAQESLADVPPPDAPFSGDPDLALTDEKLFKIIFGQTATQDSTFHLDPHQLSDLYRDIGEFNNLRRLNLSERVGLLRMRVEKEIRRLAQPIQVANRDAWHRHSVRNLVHLLRKYHPEELADQSDSFDVFFRIANAAVHSEDVPFSDLEVALNLGERLVVLLSGIKSGFDQEGTDDQT